MGGCSGFSHMDHTADVLIEARGETLERAFEESARAVYEVITDTSRVRPEVELRVGVSGIDLYNLLYRWIEELLSYTDSELLVFGEFHVESIREAGQDNWEIESVVKGERFDMGRHEHRTIVKAMTYAQMSIENLDGCWRITFVVDI